MDAQRLRDLAVRMTQENSEPITAAYDDEDYDAQVFDSPSRLPRWFQNDVSDPKNQTSIFFLVACESNAAGLELKEVFSPGNDFTWRERLFRVERVCEQAVGGELILLLMIADPL